MPLVGTALAADQLLPDVAFTDAGTGRPWRPAQLRQRSALVLCFLHAACEPCAALLSGLDERRRTIRWADAQVRVVLPEPSASPFPVLLDPDGSGRARLLGEDGQVPTVLVADRYSAAIASYPGRGHVLPEPADVVDTLRLLAIECDCSC